MQNGAMWMLDILWFCPFPRPHFPTHFFHSYTAGLKSSVFRDLVHWCTQKLTRAWGRNSGISSYLQDKALHSFFCQQLFVNFVATSLHFPLPRGFAMLEGCLQGSLWLGQGGRYPLFSDPNFFGLPPLPRITKLASIFLTLFVTFRGGGPSPPGLKKKCFNLATFQTPISILIPIQLNLTAILIYF